MLGDLCDLRDADVVAARSSAPLAAEALVLRSGGGRVTVLVANMSPAPRRVRIGNLPVGRVALRLLDDGSFAAAATEPRDFRRDARSHALDGDSLTLDLGPFAYARADVSP